MTSRYTKDELAALLESNKDLKIEGTWPPDQAADRYFTPPEPKPNKYHAEHQHEEADVDREVLRLAHLFGYLAHHTRPAWSKKGYRTPIMGDKGLPDWILCRPGRVIFIETKSSKGRLSAEQEAWQQALVSDGLAEFVGIEYYIARPDTLAEIAERIR